MPEFVYEAKDETGRTVAGQKFSSSREDLITELGRKNLTIISIQESKKKKTLKETLSEIKIGCTKVKIFELVILCKQLAVMLHGEYEEDLLCRTSRSSCLRQRTWPTAGFRTTCNGCGKRTRSPEKGWVNRSRVTPKAGAERACAATPSSLRCCPAPRPGLLQSPRPLRPVPIGADTLTLDQIVSRCFLLLVFLRAPHEPDAAYSTGHWLHPLC